MPGLGLPRDLVGASIAVSWSIYSYEYTGPSLTLELEDMASGSPNTPWAQMEPARD